MATAPRKKAPKKAGARRATDVPVADIPDDETVTEAPVVLPPPTRAMPKVLYDSLKYVAQILLPAFGALYFGLAQFWHLPSATEVVGTVTVVDTFLGVALGLSSKAYNNSDARFDGVINVEPTATGKRFNMELNGNPEHLDKQKEVVFKVQPK